MSTMQKETFPTYFTVQNAFALHLAQMPNYGVTNPKNTTVDNITWAAFKEKFPESPEDFPSFKKWALANLPYDNNTPTNQSIKAKLVEREVYCCLSDMVEALMKAEAFDLCEYLEYYGETKSGNVWTEATKDERIEELEQLLEDDELSGLDKEEAQKGLEELQDLDCDQLPDIYEYWGISSWLADKLKAEGQVVVDEFATSIWGRQTTGQAILLDSVISRIAFDMKILEHQENSWA